MFLPIYVLPMFLDPGRQKLIKSPMFSDIPVSKTTIVQRFLMVTLLNFDWGLNFEQDTPPDPADLPDPGRGLLDGAYHL